MDTNYLQMADGTQLNGTAGYASGVVWLYLNEITMQEAAVIVFDPNKTERILFVHGYQQDVFEGFTTVGAILDDDNKIKVLLRGTDTNAEIGVPISQ